MTGTSKRKGIFPSLVNREPLAPRIFNTMDERNRYVVQMREAGHTLKAIGDTLNLTREMIRLIVKANAGPSAGKVRENREANKQKEALDAFKELKTSDVETLAAHLNEKPQRVRKLLGKAAKKLPSTRMTSKKIFSDEDLLSILRSAEERVDGNLTTNKYKKLKIQPTIAVFLTRFGTWNQACEKAGVGHGLTPRISYTRAHSEEDMLAFIASYLADPRTNGTAIGYEKWQRDVEGAPSLTLIRQRIGKWNDIKARLLKEA